MAQEMTTLKFTRKTIDHGTKPGTTIRILGKMCLNLKKTTATIIIAITHLQAGKTTISRNF
jgi:hypothetical protein